MGSRERISRSQISRFEPLNQRILHIGLANVPFPLTPALSLGERGHRFPIWKLPSDSDLSTDVCEISITTQEGPLSPHLGPLPWGEGESFAIVWQVLDS